MYVLASGMIRSGGEGGRAGLDEGLLQLLDLYGCCESINSLVALPVIVIGALDVSPDGDDTMLSWHL
jgi:hypothetical protein